MQDVTVPKLMAQWITIPGRAHMGGDWVVSAIPSLAVQADSCMTLRQLDAQIPGLLALVEQWPAIARALQWTVVVDGTAHSATRKAYLPDPYADGWGDIPWAELTVRCEPAAAERRAPQIVNTRTRALARAMTGAEGLFSSARAATLAPLLRREPEEAESARFPTRIEVPPELGRVRFETLTLTASPYAPEEHAINHRETISRFARTAGPRERLGRAMLDGLSASGTLSEATLDHLDRHYFRSGRPAFPNFRHEPLASAYFDYFGSMSLPCDPWPTTTQDLRDFQEFWNGFLAYPLLARVFGITNDLILRAPASLAAGAQLSVSVRATLPSASLPAIGTATRQLIAATFGSPHTINQVIALGENRVIVVPHSRTATATPGLLPLGGCDLVSVNVDDAARKLLAVAQAEVCKQHSTVLGAQGDANMPSLSTWGLALMHPSEDRLVIADPSRTVNEVDELFAEHLTAGHRFDVRVNGSGRWTSLCARTVTYQSPLHAPQVIHCGLPPTPEMRQPSSVAAAGSAHDAAVPVFEEGIVRSAGAKVKASGDPVHRVGDEMFVWQDWPLCVPPQSAEPLEHDPRFPFLQTVTYCAGHEARLRFGHRYEVAARIAFLNGDGLTADEAEACRQQIGTSGLFARGTFDRMEPLRPPEIHVAAPIYEKTTPGDQVDVVVVRSGPDVPSRLERSERYVAPPRVAPEFANFHDDAFDAVEPAPQPPDGSLDGLFLTCTGDVPTVGEVRDKFGRKYVREEPTEQHKNDTMVVFDTKFSEEVVEEYYVDPAVRFIHAGLVASSNSCWADRLPSLEVVEKEQWPKSKLFRLEVEADRDLTEHCLAKWKGGFAGVFSPCRDVLQVRLAAAEQLVLKLWCGTAPENGARLSAYRMALQLHTGTQTTAMAPVPRKFVDVSVPFANPVREVTLIHAVQKPLDVPGFASANVGREHAGDAGVAFEGYATCHRPSTATLECFASWREFVDDVSLPAPQWVERKEASRVLHPIILKRGAGFDDRVAFDVDDDGTKRVLRHHLGSTRHRTVRYWLEGISAFAEYFPAGVACRTTLEDAEREGKLLEVSVLASEPPEPPRINAIVPMFTQREGHRGGTDTVARDFVGYRVRVGRPFFTRGFGQRLAIVCSPPGAFASGAKYRARPEAVASHTRPWPDLPKPLEPYVSRIGQDPMWPGGSPFDILPPEFFVDGHSGEAHIAFPGVQETDPQDPDDTPVIKRIEGTVSLVTYPVSHESLDGDFMEYRCDIGIDPAAVARRPEDAPYFPFVRLVFAAYQPNAIHGATLSPVVVADLIQLHPNRHAQVIYQPRSGRARLLVSGFGRPEFLASQHVDQALERWAPALEIRVQLLWRQDPEKPPEPIGAPRVLSIGRDPEGYQARWDLVRSESRRGGVWQVLVEEVWVVRCDPKRHLQDCILRPRQGGGIPFAVMEYPKTFLHMPLLNW